MLEPAEKKCDRHSATRVTAEVYKAGVARIEKLMRRRTLASRLFAQVSWGAKPMKELSESLAVFDVAMDIAHARRWDRSNPALTVSGEPTFSRAAWMPGSMLAEAIAMPMARAVAAILPQQSRTGEPVRIGRRWLTETITR